MTAIPIVPIDFESYYDPQYSLSKITTEEYIRSPLFEIIGVSIWYPGDAQPTWVDGTDPAYLYKRIHEIDWSTHAMLAHHCAFDGAIAAWRLNVHAKLYLDTMSMAQPHFGFTKGVSLATLSKELGIGEKGTEVVRALGKRRSMFSNQEIEEYGRYCNNDNVLCKKAFEKLLPVTPRRELAAIDETLRCFIEPRIVLDRSMLVEYHQQVVDMKQTNYLWAANLLGCTANDVKDTIMSNDKLALLLTELGVDPPKKLSPTTGKITFAFARTDEEFLALKEYDDEAVQMLVECRLGGKSTLAETRAARLIGIADRGTLPVMLKYYAALTGRLGGGDAINMQNLTRRSKLRDAMCAPLEHVFVAGDLSQIEARILATIAGQMDIVEAFRAYDRDPINNPDIYCVTASAFLCRPITKALNPKERQLGKVIQLALGYGMGVPKFITTAKKDGVVLTVQEAAQAHAWFRSTSSYIVQLWRNADTALAKLEKGEEYSFGSRGCIEVRSDGIHLPSGRVLRYPGLELSLDGAGHKQFTYMNRKKRVHIYGAKVVENICQSLAGSVCSDAWLRLRGHMKIVMQVHDELVGLVHVSQRSEAEARMRAAMTTLVEWLPQLPVACNVGSADRYGSIEK